MKLSIKTLSGKVVTINVKGDATILTVKQRFCDKENVPVDQQRIVFDGKDLEDDKTLVECGVKSESTLNCILKSAKKNMDLYSDIQQAELNVAKTQANKYYNDAVGLQDELCEWRDDELELDVHANPAGASFDLGRDGEFSEFVVLMFFYFASMDSPKKELEKKGFKVKVAADEKSFIDELENADIAWIISGTDPEQNKHQKRKTSSGENYPAWKTATKEPFAEAVLKFHKRGGGLYIWGDNDPFFEHANVILPLILKSNVQLKGNTHAAKILSLGDGKKKGFFGPHIITTGVVSLYEGVTISYPEPLGCLRVLATSSDGNPVICYADNEVLQDNTVGRVIVDTGFTKNYVDWDSAGTSRYITNAVVWLLGLEHKMLHNMPIAGKNQPNSK